MALTMCKIVECLKSYKQKMYKNGIKYGIRVKIGKNCSSPSPSSSSLTFYTILMKFHSRLSDDDDNRDRKSGECRH